jgi:hypothetical protein
MKKSAMLAAIMVAAGSVLAADPKDDVTSAAKKLADSENYSWHQSVDNAGGNGGGGRRGGFGGPMDGKTQKDGLTIRTVTRGDNTMQIVSKGEKGAMTNQDGEWMSFEEMAQNFGGGGGGRNPFGNFKAPAAEVQDLASKVSSLKESDGAYVGDLTEAGAKELLVPAFMRRGGGDGPEVSDAKGSVKIWVKDGALSKYQTKLQGKVSFNGNDRDIDRTTTVEIKDVGATKVTVPDEAKKKMS